MNKVFLIIIVFLVSNIGHSKGSFKKVYKAGLGCVDCFNFVAPSVFDVSTVDPAEVGQIAYDTSDDQFKGYDATGNWVQLTPVAPQAPVFHTATSSTRSGATAGHWLSMSGNSLTLEPGSWVLTGSIRFNGSAGFLQVAGYYRSGQGTDSTSAPAGISAETGRTGYDQILSVARAEHELMMPTTRITVTTPTTIYLVPVVWSANSPGASSITTYFYAQKL